MNSFIELHDSWVVGVITSGSSVVIQFAPAYVHRSEGRPGYEPGSVWLQDFDLTVSGAVLESGFAELPQQLDDGSLRVGSDIFENGFSPTLDLEGPVHFSGWSMNGDCLAVRGTRATVVAVGEDRYIEQFPGTL